MLNDFSYNIKCGDGPGRLEFAVQVIPKSPFSRVDGLRNGALLVRVKSAPEHGKANDEVRDCVASFIGVPAKTVAIEKGIASRHKTLSVPADCAPRLEAAVAKVRTP